MSVERISPRPLGSAEIIDFLNKRRAPSSYPNEEVIRASYRRAAAVLAALQEPENLQPVGGKGIKGEGQRLLADELIAATGRKFEGQVMLRPEARRAGIRELSTAGTIMNALESNQKERKGTIQQQLETYLVGNPKPLETQSLDELDATLQVAVWLGSEVAQVPSAEEVRSRLAYQTFLAPFESLAGDEVFRGRRDEMDRLRSYVGVLSPEKLLKRLSDKAFGWLKPDALPAVSISGPGGVGKSALIARFMLEHTRLPPSARLPFAYLDFDRPTLNISEPATLVAEMLDQLDLQFPGDYQYRQLRASLLRDQDEPNSQPLEQQLKKVRDVLAEMAEVLDKVLGPRPYIVAIDTFEEVQYRGENRAFPVWELLADMQKVWTSLRVVVSGRTPVKTLRMGGKDPYQIELGDLDKESAIGFLQSQNIRDPVLAAAIVKQVGGVPLSLKLAASIYQREGRDLKGVREAAGRKFWFSPADEVIQGQLYERILGHIHDPRVEKLAHPGLVLRRINPELILNVLNEPCQLSIESRRDAQDLFNELRKETTLVTSDSLDGSLIHRPDLRRVMLKLLVQKAPAQVAQIHEAAVTWYTKQAGWRSTAEEIYHRLQLGQYVGSKRLEDPEVKASLQASITELPVEAQTHLAAFGFQVSEEILDRATKEQFEAHQAAIVEDLLPYGEASVARARLLVEQEMPLERNSRLYRAAVRVAAQQSRDEEALKWCNEGLRWAAETVDTINVLQLISEKAWILRRLNLPSELNDSLPLLREYAHRHNAATAMVQYNVQKFEMSRANGDLKDVDLQINEIARLLPALSPNDVWYVFPLFEHIVEPISKKVPAALSLIRTAILAEQGPFLRVEFRDRSLRASLADLTSSAAGGADGSLNDRDFVSSCRYVSENWPFRILSVQPPYGSGGFDSAESGAAR